MDHRASSLQASSITLGVGAARPGSKSSHGNTTSREREVLALVGLGRSNADIGEILYISMKTVSVHVANIKAKLGASSRVEIALRAIDLGMVEGQAESRV